MSGKSDFGDIHYNIGKWLGRLADWAGQPVAYDVGAHTGMFSTMLADKGCDVFAFEPVPKTLIQLKSAVASSSSQERILIIEYGLSNQASELVIHEYDDESFNSLFERDQEQLEHYQLKPTGQSRIKVRTLDDIQQEQNLPLPGLIKIDIEGSELFALQGAARTIKQARPLIAMEYSTENCLNAGYDRYQLVELLFSWQYECYGLFRNEDMNLHPEQEFLDPRIWNLIAVPQESVARFTQDQADFLP